MASDAAHKFWTYRTASSKYQELAREYEQNIEQVHPERVTSDRMCTCLDYVSWCGWAASKVRYKEYRGPDVKNISNADGGLQHEHSAESVSPSANS